MQAFVAACTLFLSAVFPADGGRGHGAAYAAALELVCPRPRPFAGPMFGLRKCPSPVLVEKTAGIGYNK